MKALVIEVPGLHLGYLGCYGNDWIDTPHLDRLASESVVFDQHFADCPGSPISTSETGRYRFPLPDAGDVSAGEPANQLAAVLKANHISGHWLSALGQPTTRSEHPLMHQVFDAGTLLEKLPAASPWLVWIRLPSLAPPWEIPERYLEPYFASAESETDDSDPADETEEVPLTPWLDPVTGPIDPGDEVAWQRLQATYAAAVSHVDAALGLLLQQIEEAELGDDIVICVTANSGLALGEHGFIGDWRPWLHEELIHVPLILRLPRAAEAGRRVAALTQPVDLLPTLLDILGVPVPAELHGRSLLPLAHGRVEKVRDYACTGLGVGERVEWAIRTPNWSFLLPVRQAVDDPPRSPQLYVKPEDRWEVNNLLQQHLDWAARLEGMLRDFVAATQRPGALHHA
jgi:arylsulfatase A-like enzyme